MTAIQTSALTKKYKDLTAVNALDLAIDDGGLFALLGVNGAGKSTLIKMLSCLAKPTSGDARIFGHSIITEAHEVKKLINVSPQETAVAPNLSVRENLEFIAGIYGAKNPWESASREIEEMGLSSVAGKKAKTLSGGWQRRLSIAMALISEPKLLFLDEPTNDLDIATLTILEDYLDTFPGIVIVVSHDRYFLDRVVRRIFALEDTRMVQYEGGYTDYANRKAAEGNTESTGTAAASQPKNADEETTSKNWKNGQKRKLKFTYQEQKDYESIEGEMAALEDKIATLEADFSKYASDFVKLNELTKEKEAAEQQLEEKMERWMYLEDLAARIAEQ